MKYNLKLKLAVTMMLFALVISFSLAITNYFTLESEAIDADSKIMEEKLNLMRYALDTSERANFNIDKNIAENMKALTLQLQDQYQQFPNVEQWDYQGFSEQYGIDLYIIDEENVIQYSNVQQDIGLNFNLCCKTLASLLNERRAEGSFYVEGFDVEQATGAIKSYSYMGTPDQKYIIQLGFSWNDNPLFKQFNFLDTITRLKQSDSSILDMNVLNLGGLAYGKSEDQYKLDQKGREAFQYTLNTGEDSLYEGSWGNQDATFLYSLYISEEDLGASQTKVIELIYSKQMLQLKLDQYKKTFSFQILLILLVTTILSWLLSRWLAKPIYLAFHDTLTSLGNRAYFEEYIQSKFANSGRAFTLIMIDVDNFKLVNDNHGHDFGDKLLQSAANLMKDAVLDDELVFRLGGDEFIIVIPNNNLVRAEELAKYLLVSFQEQIATKYEFQFPISLSIGISTSSNNEQDVDSLMQKADQALYTSKKQGKNTYSY